MTFNNQERGGLGYTRKRAPIKQVTVLVAGRPIR